MRQATAGQQRIFKRDDPGCKFRRLDLSVCSLGVFIGQTNYLKGRGIEVFAGPNRRWPRALRFLVNWHLGFSRPSIWGIRWSGSMNEPWHSWTFRFGWIGFGSETFKFVQRWLRARRERRWEREASEF